VWRQNHFLSFQAKAGASYSLLFGNPTAPRPDYDLAHYVDRLRAESVQAAALGKAVENPAGPAKPVQWSEEHSGLIWAALAVVIAAMGWLIYRQARSMAKGKAEGGQAGE
jgi:hypothetical protein